MKRKASNRKMTKKQKTQFATGVAAGVGGDTLLDVITGGFLTDTTGRFIKIGVGVVAVVAADDYMLKGVGAGVAANSGYAQFVSPNNRTIGGEVVNLIAPSTMAGLPYYAGRQRVASGRTRVAA